MQFTNKVTTNQEGGAGLIGEETLISAMARYHAEIMEAGALLDGFGFGLQPSLTRHRITSQGSEAANDRRAVAEGRVAIKATASGPDRLSEDPQRRSRGARDGHGHPRSGRSRRESEVKQPAGYPYHRVGLRQPVSILTEERI